MSDDVEVPAKAMRQGGQTREEPEGNLDPISYLEELAKKGRVDHEDIKPVLNIIQRQTQLSYETYQGSLLPPRALAQYDEIVPGSAARFVQIYEDQVSHRKALERERLDALTSATKTDAERSYALANRGSWTAIFIAVALVGLAYIAVIKDQAWPAFGIVFTTISGIVSAFIARSRR